MAAETRCSSKRQLVRAVLTLLLFFLTSTVEARTVVDSAGRNVEVPDKIDKVFAAGDRKSVV